MSIFKKAAITLACLAFFAIGARASVGNVYIAQNATGAANGADCADAYPASFFNSSANWGSGSNQIGPGTTVHLCGTFTGPAGSTMLTIQGSGASGSPVTVLFESGAQLNAPYWSAATGAIFCSGSNYITIDGNMVGVISNTANGTTLANQQASTGIEADNCSSFTVQNLTVKNLYQRTSQSDENGGSFSTQAIDFKGGNVINVRGNTINNARYGVFMAFGSSLTSYSVYNNKIDYSADMIWVGDSNSGYTASGINIYGNTLGPHFNVWDDQSQNVHGDGIFVYAANPGSTASANVFNNAITGDMCQTQGNCTAYIFFQGMNHSNVFNNVVQHTGPTTGVGIEAMVRLGDSSSGTGTDNEDIGIYNNTFVGGGQTALKSDAGTGIVFENNIMSGVGQAYWDNTNGAFPWLATANYNVLYNMTARIALGQAAYSTLPSWQALGFDGGSISSNPSLSSVLSMLSTSPATTLGTNLTNLGLTALDSDKNGNPRPTSGAWAAGAIQVSANAPAPPSAVTAVVQ